MAEELMGEAKRRGADYAAAKQRLLDRISGEEKIIAESALALFDGYILPNAFSGGCYVTTMILHRYLSDERGIQTDPVVGFVNDGTDDIFISHAWLEFQGRKVDLTLHVTNPQTGARPGALIILDHVLRPGSLTYSYHQKLTAAAIRQNALMASDPVIGKLLAHKDAEHRLMAKRAGNRLLMDGYLDDAPKEQSYSAMRAFLP